VPGAVALQFELAGERLSADVTRLGLHLSGHPSVARLLSTTFWPDGIGPRRVGEETLPARVPQLFITAEQCSLLIYLHLSSAMRVTHNNVIQSIKI
jgi:hypothetical protein